MIPRGKVHQILDSYNKEQITIATIGSHTALQILKGARDENFRNLVICKKGSEEVYRQFGVADEILLVRNFDQVLEKGVQEELIHRNAILIPHGSFIEYVGPERIEEELLVPMFGNRRVLDWESDRKKERKWMEKAGLKVPGEFEKPEEIDRLVMIKFPGAKGGKGYFLARDKDEFYQRIKKLKLDEKEEFTIQEYGIGTRFYPHYFYSPMIDRVELLGMDIRYESNIDGIARISHIFQENLPESSFVVTGNTPVVIRESLLPQIMEMGQNVVRASKELFDPGLIGPFCIETICSDELEFMAFEISARIVAGTNLYINGSPYSRFLYKEEMSTGRRVAREIKKAIEEDSLERIVC